MYFRKPSDIGDACDKMADINNHIVDNKKQKLKDEIDLLWENRYNPDALRKYFLDCFSKDNFIARVIYAKQLRSYTVKKLYDMAELRANVLYRRINNLDFSKVDNMPLKVIVQELKALGQ